MCIVYEQSEIELFFHGNDLFQFALRAGHAEYTFSNHQNGAAGRFYQFGGTLQLLLKAFHVVVVVNESFSHVQTNPVDDTGVRFSVVNDYIVAIHQCVDGAQYTLVSIIQEDAIGFLYKAGEVALELLMVVAVTAHHAGAHGVCHTKLCCCVCIGLHYIGVIGQSQVVV